MTSIPQCMYCSNGKIENETIICDKYKVVPSGIANGTDICTHHANNKKLLKLQNEYSELFNNDYFIFPENWFEIEDQDELKVKILKEAIKNKKLIINVEGGNTFLQKI